MRDATDYYNLLSDTLRSGYYQIKKIYDKIDDAIQEGKFINIRTGYLIKEKDSNNNNYYFNYDREFPLCYNFSCCGLARRGVIKRIIDFYISCLKKFDRDQDEEQMRIIVENEIESARKDYEHLNKNNNGLDDLKLFNIPPHRGEPKEVEESYNSSSFINDENSSSKENNSFINDDEIKEEEENERKENEDEDGNEEEEEEEDGSDLRIKKKKKSKLIKNGKKVVNEYKKELDDLLEDNYDGEDELKKEEEEEEDDLDLDLDLTTKYSSFKKKKLSKKFLNKKQKRNIINDSEEEENEKDENKDDEKENNKENEKEENNSKNDEKKNNITEKVNLVQEMKNMLKKEEEEDECDNNNNNGDVNKTKNKKKVDEINKEYYKSLKENICLRQGTLDAFLKMNN